MTITVICEECGKQYHIPAERLDKIQGPTARTKCKQCGHILTIEKPEPVEESEPKLEDLEIIEETPASETPAETVDPPQVGETSVEAETAGEPEPPTPAETEAKPKKIVIPNIKTKGLGLRAKMILLFLVVPLILMAASGYISQQRMNALSSNITNESTAIVTQMAKDEVISLARSAAKECKLYLDNHPELRAEDFASEALLKQLAVQKVGKTGYTALHSVDPFVTWVHPNAKLKGVQLTKVIKKLLGSEYPRFYKIIEAAEKGKNIETQGYYLWKDPDGVKREKFMVITPIRGTRYGIAATTYMHEFISPLKKLESRTQQAAIETRNINFGIMVVTLLIVGIIVSLYGHRLTNNIKHLTDVADRISVGELDAEIQIKSKDEIGSLAEAISRMQDSLRLSIMRLRRKR
jgi:HAMP domain-containing protein/cell division protein FtsL